MSFHGIMFVPAPAAAHELAFCDIGGVAGPGAGVGIVWGGGPQELGGTGAEVGADHVGVELAPKVGPPKAEEELPGVVPALASGPNAFGGPVGDGPAPD